MNVDEGNPGLPKPVEDGLQLDSLGPGPADYDEHALIGAPPEITPEEQERIDLATFKTFYTPSKVRAQTSLLQWQRLFAAWYAHLPVPPQMNDCIRYVRALTTYRIGGDALRVLMKRDDWKKLLVHFRESEQRRAKELLNADYQVYVDAHRRGLDMALAAEDHRGIPAFTVPILDRIAPKREDTDVRAPTVVINISGGAAQSLRGYQMGTVAGVAGQIAAGEEPAVADILDISSDSDEDDARA